MKNIDYNLQLELLCKEYNLGDLLCEPEQLTGGLLHRMYSVETTSGKYAVKALNPQVVLRPKARSNILSGERIAKFASHYIPALSAKQFGEVIMPSIDGQHYLVYEWIDGNPVYGDNITSQHCIKIGKILGKLHSINFSSLNIPKDNPVVGTMVNWSEYLEKGKQKGLSWVTKVSDNLDNLYNWNRRYITAMKYLEKPLVIGHGDIDPKNVMWLDNNPVVIDWESAGYLNPAHEFVVCAMYWADSNGKPIKKDFLLSCKDI